MPYVIIAVLLLVGIIIWRFSSHGSGDSESLLSSDSSAAKNNMPSGNPSVVNSSDELQESDDNVVCAKDILDHFLSENGCKVEYHDSDEDDRCFTWFTYQGEHFYADVSTKSGKMNLIYYNFYEADTSEAEKVLRIVNDYNNNYAVVKFLVAFSEEKNKVIVNLSYETLNAAISDIQLFVDNVSSMAQDMRNDMASDDNLKSSEQDFDSKRRSFLLSEVQFQHQKIQLIANEKVPLALGSVISNIFGSTEALLLERMTVHSGGQSQCISGTDNVFKFNVISAIYDAANDKLSDSAVLEIQAERANYVLQLRPIENTEFVVYIRLTVLQSKLDAILDSHLYETQNPKTISVVIAYDKLTEQNQHSEFKYMWLEAQDKVRQGKQSELSPEQRALVDLEQNSTSEAIYRGNKLFCAKRYIETIETLLPVYKEMKPKYFSCDNKTRNVFYDVCYLIGFSYCELKQYEYAYYYLELANAAHRYDYTAEYINSLTNSGDIRALYAINNIIDVLKDNVKSNPDGEPTDSERSYFEFLLRRQGYANIEFGDLDSAEKIFTDLLDYPQSHDYAQDELDYISKLRRSQENNK